MALRELERSKDENQNLKAENEALQDWVDSIAGIVSGEVEEEEDEDEGEDKSQLAARARVRKQSSHRQAQAISQRMRITWQALPLVWCD